MAPEAPVEMGSRPMKAAEPREPATPDNRYMAAITK